MPDFLKQFLEHLWAPFASLSAIIGILVGYIWNHHRKRVDALETDVNILKQTVVYRSDLDLKAEEIKAEVKKEHERIIETLDSSIQTMRVELVTCNQNVMSHVSILSSDIREIRDFIFHHLERRQKDRD